jgi:hypothetical protein
VSDGVTSIERAGDISNAQAKWTGNATLSYQTDRFSAFVDVTHIGSGKYDNTFVLPTDINDNTISSRTYVGFQASFDAGERDAQREIFFNVSNLFNVRPPAVFIFSGGPNYERVGRSFRVGVRFAPGAAAGRRQHAGSAEDGSAWQHFRAGDRGTYGAVPQPVRPGDRHRRSSTR